jgi:hypothetical protein
MRRLAALAVLLGVAVMACAQPVTPAPAATSSSSQTPAAAAPTPPATTSPAPTPSPAPTLIPGTPTAPASAGRPTPRPTAAPSPTAVPTPDGGTVTGFWALVEHGIRGGQRLQVAIAGPTAGTLRFETTASSTVIEGVVGSVCLGGHLYDGLSGFAALPGKWTCGPKALVAGFRNIGQPVDSWSAVIHSDRARRETVVQTPSTWTWRYAATSPDLGGAVTTDVTLDRATGRITSARRTDPTGVTTYSFTYGATFPRIAVPH